MFSLENLAIKITSSDDTGAMIDDEYGTIIPASEAGSNGGRIMWFPPYNISVFETTAAKFESTVMVGRSEPMYNYQNSERSATLSFTLLIDYPPQLRDQQFKNDNTNKNIAEFFAFGFKGATITKPPTNTTNPKAIKDQQNKIVPTTTTTAPVDTISPSAVNAYFPNDVPNDGQVQRAYQYIFEASYNPSDYNNNGIYNINSDQYKYESGVELNNDLFNIYSKYENADQYTISIVGNASQLYYEADEQVAYNLALGQRRADATKILINARLSDMVAQGCITDDTYNKIKITASSHGSASAPNSTAYPNIPNPTDADKAKVYNNAASIQSRNAIITISKNSTTPPPKDLPKAQQPTAAQHQNNVDTNKTISALAKTAYQQKTAVINPLYDDMFVERGADNTDSNTNNNNSDSFKPLVGFENIAKDYYVPVYHSQTPEEFHRRLTFLNQCMRQGQAQNFDKLTIKNSVFGRQPICVLRIGDFFFTKVIIENLNIDYADCTWDMNPEGFGMQPMIAHITLQMKLIGGQSLAGPINALQNAVAFNYYANSTYTDQGMYYKPSQEEIKQYY
jgi:outer membrane protein OmpA-like peptidoglycan-associated protein